MNETFHLYTTPSVILYAHLVYGVGVVFITKSSMGPHVSSVLIQNTVIEKVSKGEEGISTPHYKVRHYVKSPAEGIYEVPGTFVS